MDAEEQVSDVLEDVVEVAKKNGLLIPVALGLLVVGAGLGIGYLIGQRRKYEVIKLGDRLPTAPPKVIVDADTLDSTPPKGATLQEIIVGQEYIADKVDEIAVTVNDQVVETRNIFAHAATEEWNYEEEIEKRNPLAPYIIHHNEFFGEEMAGEGYLQIQLTYYEGDGVLVDESTEPVKPIHNASTVVGPLRWGHGSDDPNVVYVRNMPLNTEYEITRDQGHYRIEVLGLEMEEAATVKQRKEERARQSRMRPE